MDLLFFRQALSSHSSCGRIRCRKSCSQTRLPGKGENGDIVLPFIITLMSGALLFSGLFFLNKLYEHRTKEELNDFKTNWQNLESKYQD